MATDGRPRADPLQAEPSGAAKRLRQVLWFVGIWCASLAALSSVAYAIRAVLL